jgi:hypothetical protein
LHAQLGIDGQGGLKHLGHGGGFAGAGASEQQHQLLLQEGCNRRLLLRIEPC